MSGTRSRTRNGARLRGVRSALALLDQHISEEQRKELGRRIIDRLTFLGRPTS